MTVTDFMNLTKAYALMTTVLAKNIDTGDQDETEYINNLKLKDISEFLQKHQLVPCQRCNHTGTIYDPKTEDTKTCPACNGNGGYFKEDEIECYL